MYLIRTRYNTTALKAILVEITAKKPALESAVAAKDKDALKTVNLELVNLWKEFGKVAKSVLKTDVPL